MNFKEKAIAAAQKVAQAKEAERAAHIEAARATAEAEALEMHGRFCAQFGAQSEEVSTAVLDKPLDEFLPAIQIAGETGHLTESPRQGEWSFVGTTKDGYAYIDTYCDPIKTLAGLGEVLASPPIPF